jgi:hypothetical protein
LDVDDVLRNEYGKFGRVRFIVGVEFVAAVVRSIVEPVTQRGVLSLVTTLESSPDDTGLRSFVDIRITSDLKSWPSRMNFEASMFTISVQVTVFLRVERTRWLFMFFTGVDVDVSVSSKSISLASCSPDG